MGDEAIDWFLEAGRAHTKCMKLADEIDLLRDIARRTAELPYFKNPRIEALVRDAKDALVGNVPKP